MMELSPALRLFQNGLGPEARASLDAALAREVERLAAQAPGPERARALHQRLDEASLDFDAVKPELAAAVRCRSGCAHCCRIWVAITQDEAELLAERVRQGAACDRARLQAQQGLQRPGDFAALPLHEARCAFLDSEGRCGVYADRPAACRSLRVTSDPELCRDAEASTRITTLINPLAELLVSAARSLDAREHPGAPTHLAARMAGLISG